MSKRITVDLSEADYGRLEKLVEVTEATSKAEAIRRTIRHSVRWHESRNPQDPQLQEAASTP